MVTCWPHSAPAPQAVCKQEGDWLCGSALSSRFGPAHLQRRWQSRRSSRAACTVPPAYPQGFESIRLIRADLRAALGSPPATPASKMRARRGVFESLTRPAFQLPAAQVLVADTSHAFVRHLGGTKDSALRVPSGASSTRWCSQHWQECSMKAPVLETALVGCMDHLQTRRRPCSQL